MTSNDKTTSRREFLAGALGAAVGACALTQLSSSGAFAAAAPARAQRIKLGLATYMWGMDWDIPTLIANLKKAEVFGVELRTQSKYAHGVELELTPQQRSEVKKQFADSPITMVSLACSEQMDWPEPEKLKAAIEAAKKYLKLSKDVGARSLRVFPNTFHPEVPHEKTIEQIAKAVNELGTYAMGIGQRVDLEAHGPAGELATMHAIMERVDQKAVGIRLNCDARDNKDGKFEENFNSVKDHLAHTIHLHLLNDPKEPKYPYQQMFDLLTKAKWRGWTLMENSDNAKFPDRVQAMIEQRKIWEGMLAKAAQA